MKRYVTSKLEPKSLSGLPLAHALMEADGAQLFGPARGPFAFFSRDASTLYVACTDRQSIQVLEQPGIDASVLKHAQEMEANFIVRDNAVTCVIGKVSATGANYAEAASRALLAFVRVE